MDDRRRARFEELFGAHFDAVLAFALARAQPDVAKDVTAETFLAAWRSLDRLPAEPKGWLLAVTRRKLADHYRSRGRQEALTTRLTAQPAPPAADPADQVSERQVVLAAFSRLPPPDQEVLRLIAWDGLTFEEAAQVVGCSRALLAVRLHRARRRLRVHLATEEDPLRRPAARPRPVPARPRPVPATVEENR